MTPDRFRECLTALHWTQRGLARILDRPEGTVRQWARGAVRIPEDVKHWLEYLTFHHKALPVPRGTTVATAAAADARESAG